MRDFTAARGRIFMMLAVVFAALVLRAGASATLFVEEPYGKLGFFTATGHAAVYLSGVCAQTPLILRRCAPGESGIVLSRYDGVAGYDWLAIPLVPYLYAVERPEDVPLFVDARMVAFLRDRYRRKYLKNIIPDLPNGETPGGNWYELVGSSYDRTTYGFEIATTAEQDEALIRKLNSSPNHSHFHILTRNCADFVKDIINFYQPKALHRSYVADVGISTPKQMGKTLVAFEKRHPDLEVSRFIIPQVPGNRPRSKTVHRVMGSFLTSKKYIIPSAVASPIFAGSVAAVFVASGGGPLQSRFPRRGIYTRLRTRTTAHRRGTPHRLRSVKGTLGPRPSRDQPVTTGRTGTMCSPKQNTDSTGTAGRFWKQMSQPDQHA